MRVIVTDADSGFAQALLPALCARAGVESVTGIALRPPVFTHARFRAIQADYRESTALLAGHDALVHLGASMGTAASDTLEAAVRPVHRFFHAANDAGIRRLVHVSTAAVYGAAVHASEHSPLKP